MLATPANAARHGCGSRGCSLLHRLQGRNVSSGAEDQVQFQVVNNKGVIRLNRPKALNALTTGMALKMLPVLREWNGSSSSLDFVLIEAEGGKAFCAGGDVRVLTEGRSAGGKATRDQTDFFSSEYRVNHLIGTLRLPFVALIHGITMGGGVGLSVHGTYRVATEKTVFAMPETMIGLFPDVGGSYFLPRLRGRLGTYLALAGPRLKGVDCLKAGIATHVCASERIPELREALIGGKATDLAATLSRFSSEFSHESSSSFGSDLKLIDEYFSGSSVEEIFDKLEGAKGREPFAAKALETLQKCSPTSLKVTFRQMEEGKKLRSLRECLEMEYRIVVRCCEGNDFYEGVRAVLVDKDNSPEWKPPTLESVSNELVDKHFSKLPSDSELRL